MRSALGTKKSGQSVSAYPFIWQVRDKTGKVRGGDPAELEDGGGVIKFRFHKGDQATLRARKW